MESFLDERLIAETTTEVNHSQVKKVVAPTEIAQIDEIALIANENGVAVLEVAMDGRVFIGDISDETLQTVLFHWRKEGAFLEESIITVFNVLELCGIHVCCMEFKAHLGKFGSKLHYFFRLICRGTRIGFLP